MKSKILLLSILIATPAFGMDYIKNLLGYTADSYKYDHDAARIAEYRLNNHSEDNFEIIETDDQKKLRQLEEILRKQVADAEKLDVNRDIFEEIDRQGAPF